MLIRVGLPKTDGLLPRVAAAEGYHALVSAGSMWRRLEGRFAPPAAALRSVRSVALDSAGFVAMKLHGGYPWTVQQYVGLAASWPWAWWSSMDLCCEPQIAGDRAAVAARIRGTVQLLVECREEAARAGCSMPMPILQGWEPADYIRCADAMEPALGEWPALVGVGSVCRRPLQGATGLWSVLPAILRRLPVQTKLHLFGVKGSALKELTHNQRVASVDSCAWDSGVRMDVIKERRATGLDIRAATAAIPCTVRRRAAGMVNWMEAQTDASRSLFGGA